MRGEEHPLLTRLGDDAFADIAYRTWQDAGVQPVVVKDTDSYTGAASIFIEASSGDNAIIVCPGAASRIYGVLQRISQCSVKRIICIKTIDASCFVNFRIDIFW